MDNQGILLESGTNEMELLEFFIGNQGIGVNVAKIQAIEPYAQERVTKVPLAHEAVAGMLLFRDRTIPLIDLTKQLNVQSRPTNSTGAEETNVEEKRIVLAMEFNNMATAFLVDGVNRIHRISWKQISPLSAVFAQHSPDFTGSVQIEGREILIVDVEKIVAELLPQTCPSKSRASDDWNPFEEDRSLVKIILAEDSHTIRSLLEGVLASDNYTNVQSFDNGQEAFETVVAAVKTAQEQGEPLSKHLGVVITDIEMPQMDGLALCKQVKEISSGQHLPIIMFSSLINEQMRLKCLSVGADACISKPQFGELVKLLDKLCLEPAMAV